MLIAVDCRQNAINTICIDTAIRREILPLPVGGLKGQLINRSIVRRN